MKPFNIIKRERGISLIEALISLLIIAITTVGSLYIVSRANGAKTQMSLQDLAVHQLRAKLMNTSKVALCNNPGTINLPDGSAAGRDVNVVINSGCGANAVMVAGGNPALADVGMTARVILQVTDPAFGGDGIIVVGGS